MTYTQEQIAAFEESMANTTGEFPSRWNPEPGEVLVGEVVRYEAVESKYGDGPVQVCVLHTEHSGEIAIWLSKTQLKARFDDIQPKPGELIGIRYLGENTGKNGRQYHAYAVRVFSRDTEGTAETIE